MMPQFTDPNQAKSYLVGVFKKLIKDIEETKTHQEKVKIMEEFNMTQFTAEDQPLGDKTVKDYPEYQKAKNLVYDFFKWIEENKKIDLLKAMHEDPFFNESQGVKTMLIAMTLQILQAVSTEMQVYLVLNIFRTTYELNFKNMTLILNEVFKKEGKQTKPFYYIDTFENEFVDYPRLDEVKNYFKNDIRNPIAHEDWFVKNGWLWTRHKGLEKKQDMMEISKQIYELFYFRVALSTYLLGKYKDFAKDKDITPQHVSKFIEGIKTKLKELENGNY